MKLQVLIHTKFFGPDTIIVSEKNETKFIHIEPFKNKLYFDFYAAGVLYDFKYVHKFCIENNINEYQINGVNFPISNLKLLHSLYVK